MTFFVSYVANDVYTQLLLHDTLVSGWQQDYEIPYTIRAWRVPPIKASFPDYFKVSLLQHQIVRSSWWSQILHIPSSQINVMPHRGFEGSHERHQLCALSKIWPPRQWLAVGIFVGDQPWQSIGASWPRLHPDPDWLKSAPYPALPHGGNPPMDGELPSEWYIIVVAGESTLNKPKDCSGGQLCGDYGIYHMNPYDSWPVYTQFCWLNMMKSPFVTSNWGGSLDPGEPISASPMSQRFQNWLH